MTWQFNTNIVGGTTTDNTGIAVRALLDLMIANGTHSIVGSGDGRTNFENTGDTAGPYDILSLGPTYPANLDFSFSNPLAWFRFRETGTTREWVLSRYSAASIGFSRYMSMSFSPTGYVSTGTASATVPPTAPADVLWLHGTGYGALAGSSWGPAGGQECYIHAAVQDVAVAGVYPFYYFSRLRGSKAANGFWLWDSVSEGIVGDTQPWLNVYPPFGVESTIAGMKDDIGAYSDYGGGGEAWLGCSPMGFQDNGNGSRIFPGGVGPQVDGLARTINVPVGRVVAGFYKGVSDSMRWKGAQRGYPDVENLSLTTAQVYVDDILLPWAQGVVPL